MSSRMVGRWMVLGGVLSLLVAAPALAAQNNLDPTFGTGGKVITELGVFESANDMAIQPDGKIVIAGIQDTESGPTSFLVARYLPNGALDSTFGAGGSVSIVVGEMANALAVALQPDGKIVVGGNDGALLTLFRYLPGGSLDPSFGTGGKVFSSLGAPFQSANDVAIGPGGSILAAGNWNPSGESDVFVARYLPNGLLDTSFGTGGLVSTSFYNDDGLERIALQADGKIVGVGATDGPSANNPRFILARYTAAGALDPTFDGDGRQETSFCGCFGSATEGARDVVIQADGRIVVVGDTGDAMIGLARYQANGSLDPTFGSGGLVTTGLRVFTFGRGVVLQGDGKIVVGGSTTDGFLEDDFALVRYGTDGSVDQAFGTDGSVVTDFGGVDQISELAIQPDSKLVAAGVADLLGPGGADIALARYLKDDFAPPQTTITSGPSGRTSDHTPTFKFASSEPGSTFECRIDAGADFACTSPYTTPALVRGRHTFRVRAIDLAGNADGTRATRSFRVCDLPTCG